MVSDWSSFPTFIVGGGPSLTPYISKLPFLNRAGKVLAVNDGYRHCNPDVVFSLDHVWLEKRKGDIPSIPAPVVVAVGDGAHKDNVPNLQYVDRVRRQKGYDLILEPGSITNGLTSGFGALNLAVQYKSRLIYLLGFDYQDSKSGASHFHSGYDWFNKQDTNCLYKTWARALDSVADQLRSLDVMVWNCSNESALKAYPHKSYEEVFSWVDVESGN